MITAADIAEIVKDLRTRSESCEKLAASHEAGTVENRRLGSKADAYEHSAVLVERWGRDLLSRAAPPSSG